MVSLKDFLKETLTQIVEANAEFLEAQGPSGATTTPQTPPGGIAGERWANHGLMFAGFVEREGERARALFSSVIEFDVAITADESNQNKSAAGIGIRVLEVFNAGAGGEAASQTTNSSVSRIKFRLPLQMTVSGDPPQQSRPRGLRRAQIEGM